MLERIEKPLPDETKLIAEIWDEPEYPGIRISLATPGYDDELLCFVEYNSARLADKRLCVAVYSNNQDEPSYYESYGDPQTPSKNV